MVENFLAVFVNYIQLFLTLYSIIHVTPFHTFEIQFLFENLMENGVFGPFEQTLHFP